MTDDIRELMSRAFSGNLTPEESNRLLAACQADPKVREQLAELTIAERLLAAAHSDADATLGAREVLARLAPALPNTERFLERLARRTWWALFGPRIAWGAALCAVIAATIWLTFHFQTAATIIRVESATWSGKSLAANSGLRSGQRIAIGVGLAELQFKNGAVVLVEGPADFEIRSSSSAFLHYGRCVASVPEQARGFIIDSPQGRLVDLGTQFGISVDRSGETEVHVLEGLVEAHMPNLAQPLNLRANQGARFISSGTTFLQADERSFVTEMPPRPDTLPGFIHWTFDEGDGHAARNVGRGLGDEDAHLELRSGAAKLPQFPKWITSPFGHGLDFDGIGAYAECRYRGIGGSQARTIAAWIRVPTDFKPEEGYGIVGWGFPSPGKAWQLSANPDPNDGDIGRLRIGASMGAVVGTTDLRDGKWHHVAAVMYGGAQPNIGTHVLLYVDGQLDPASRKSVREIDTETTKASHGLWVGRNMSAHASPLPWRNPGGPYFRGAVDELFIVATALSQEQIQRLMSENRL